MARSLDSVLHYPDAVAQVRAVGEAVYWLATIAAEDGRTTVRRFHDGTVEDLTPAANVRSRAMEYGGGAYAVDGDRLAWCDDVTGRVWLRDADGERPVTPEGRRFVYGGLVLADDALLAVREDHAAEPEARTEIVALEASGNSDGGRVLATGADFYGGIAARGPRIAWMQWDHPNMSWDTCAVWAGTRDGAAGPVCATDGVSAKDPIWLPDGRLAFVSDEGGWWNWRIDGGAAQEAAVDCAPPTWVLNPPVAAGLPDGRLATVVYREGRGELGIWDPETGALDFPLPGTADIESLAASGGRLFAVAQWPDRDATLVEVGVDEPLAGPREGDPAVVLPEAIWADGDAGPVHSWLYRPQDENPPLLVLTHGGPTSMTRCSYDATIQFWVSRGFAVLDVNYSGSTGFGRAYRDRLRGNWGLLDVSDTVAAVRAVTASGLADPARVAITGGSAGGYTTLRSLTSTDVYAAGISRYGIGDLTTLATDTHKAESRYLDGLVAPWPDGRAVYEDRSPINDLDRLATPMLILQGTDDKVVPPNQAIQMADAVLAAGQPVALVMLEGEGHGFRAMANRRRAMEAQVSFLQQVFGLPDTGDVPPLAFLSPAP
ncbi:MAG: prolyl oligopeptidase family serine peptidase [Arachnia sp.]